ncbi:MAG TPA: substrate-binding domain-containing protein [Bryobacteraceae bacterium]|nr:substrate-binding domain-containing protein [Bryobacteraceae bacterium]
MSPRPEANYFVPTTSKTLDVLEAFKTPGEELTLEQVVTRAKVARTTAFRILYTLEQRRYVTRRGKLYRLNPVRKKIRVGFGSLTDELPFARVVTSSLMAAAAPAGIDLLVFDNHRDGPAAIGNARKMVAQKVDVAIEFQRHVDVSPIIADIFSSAGVPLIAVHIPHPGAIYFGVDNYKSGYRAGAALASFAQNRWAGQFDLLILLDIPQGGIVLQSRIAGVVQALEASLGPLPPGKVARISGGAERNIARRNTAAVLKANSKAKRILVAAGSDDGSLGALDALEDAERTAYAGVVGMEGSEDAISEIAKDKSCYIGTVAFFPEKYGAALIDLVFRLVNGQQVPPFWYVDHEFIDRLKARQILGSSSAA